MPRRDRDHVCGQRRCQIASLKFIFRFFREADHFSDRLFLLL